MQYTALVDGEPIAKVDLPDANTQAMRDAARKTLANKLHIPTHYIKLRPSKIAPISIDCPECGAEINLK